MANNDMAKLATKAASHQDGADEAHLEDGGAQVEDERAQHEGDAPRAAVDSLGQRPRLAAEVEAQVQIVQVQEDVLGDATDGALGHLAEHRVPQLVEEGGAGPRGAVWGGEGCRRGGGEGEGERRGEEMREWGKRIGEEMTERRRKERREEEYKGKKSAEGEKNG